MFKHFVSYMLKKKKSEKDDICLFVSARQWAHWSSHCRGVNIVITLVTPLAPPTETPMPGSYTRLISRIANGHTGTHTHTLLCNYLHVTGMGLPFLDFFSSKLNEQSQSPFLTF